MDITADQGSRQNTSKRKALFRRGRRGLVANLAQMAEQAEEQLPAQKKQALFDALTEGELAKERRAAERVRDIERDQRVSEAVAEAKYKDRQRKTTADIRRIHSADLVRVRRAVADLKRSDSPVAQVSDLYRAKNWMLAVLAGALVAGMIWSAINVQQQIVPGGSKSDPLFWASYLLEAMISLQLVVIMIAEAKVSRWGGLTVSRGKIVTVEGFLLALSVALNSGRYALDQHWFAAAQHAVAPLMIGSILLLHTGLSAMFGTAIANAAAHIPPSILGEADMVSGGVVHTATDMGQGGIDAVDYPGAAIDDRTLRAVGDRVEAVGDRDASSADYERHPSDAGGAEAHAIDISAPGRGRSQSGPKVEAAVGDPRSAVGGREEQTFHHDLHAPIAIDSAQIAGERPGSAEQASDPIVDEHSASAVSNLMAPSRAADAEHMPTGAESGYERTADRDRTAGDRSRADHSTTMRSDRPSDAELEGIWATAGAIVARYDVSPLRVEQLAEVLVMARLRSMTPQQIGDVTGLRPSQIVTVLELTGRIGALSGVVDRDRPAMVTVPHAEQMPISPSGAVADHDRGAGRSPRPTPATTVGSLARAPEPIHATIGNHSPMISNRSSLAREPWFGVALSDNEIQDLACRVQARYKLKQSVEDLVMIFVAANHPTEPKTPTSIAREMNKPGHSTVLRALHFAREELQLMREDRRPRLV